MYVLTKNSRVAQNNMRGATLSSALTSALRARPQRHGTSRIARGVVQCAAPRGEPRRSVSRDRPCYDVVERMGRGAVYLGSARVPEDHPHFAAAKDLARDVALALDCTTWSGLGAGMMEAVTRGRMEAGKPVAGFMILLEAGGMRQASREHPYLPQDVYHTTSFFSARKHGLVDAGVRNAPETDRVLRVTRRRGHARRDLRGARPAATAMDDRSAHPVPFIVMNYRWVFRRAGFNF